MMGNAVAKDKKDNLAKLINGTRSGKRAKQRKEFLDQWVAIAEETQLDEETFNLLLDGFNFAHAEPLYRYASGAERPPSIYSKFHRYQKAKNNKDWITLRLMLSLFALELLQPSSEDSLEAIVPKLSSYTKNRGNVATDFNNGKFIQQLVLSPLSGKHISENAKLRVETARSLLVTIQKPLCNYVESSNSKQPKKAVAQSLLEWIEEQAGRGNNTDLQTGEAEVKESHNEDSGDVSDSIPDESGPANNQAQHDAVELIEESSQEPREQEPAAAESGSQGPLTPNDNPGNDLPEDVLAEEDNREAEEQFVGEDDEELTMEKVLTLLKSIEIQQNGTEIGEGSGAGGKSPGSAAEGVPDIGGIIEFLTVYEEEREKQGESLKQAKKDIIKANDQVHLLKAREDKYRCKVEEERNQQAMFLESWVAKYNELSEQCSELQQKLELAAQANERLQQRIKDAEDVIVVLEEHAVAAAEASAYQMAEELKFEYRDYMRGRDQEMTSDLGKAMRYQLGRVFEILEKNGVDVHGEA